jgi:putative membrane protein insertion efficiency factor
MPGPAVRPDSDAPLARAGRAVWRLPRTVLVGLVRLYQGAVSPWLGPSCRFTPTCSEYAAQALRRYGAVRGTVLALWRIGRCHPWGGHGYDPPRWFGEPADGPQTDADGGTRPAGRG